MFALQLFSPMPAASGTKPFEVTGQATARMLRPASSHHCPQGILWMCGLAHGRSQPVIEKLHGVIDQLRMLRGKVALHMRVLANVEQHPVRETMIAIMVGTDAEVVLETDGTLTRPGHLRENQVIPAPIGSVAQSVGKPLAIPVARDFAARELQDSGGQIHVR